SLEALGDQRRAVSILGELAPPDRPGYPAAQLRLAQILLNEKPTPQRALWEAERHLRQALAGERTSVAANTLLAQILMATGRPEQATSFLHQAATDRPELRITLARVYRAVNQ